MQELTTEEIKDIQLSILDRVHKWCQENALDYTLDFGTLIGAIRHKGYIPWDDDIDVSLLRDSYDKLIKTFNGNPPEFLKLYSIETDPNYILPFAKIADTRYLIVEPIVLTPGLGINIDVFPYDSIPEGDAEWHKFQSKQDYYSKQYARTHSNPCKKGLSLYKRVYLLGSRLLAFGHSARYYSKKKQSLIIENPDSKYVSFALDFFTPVRTLRDNFAGYIDVNFEGRKFKALSEYDNHLRQYYGDYMQLPPKEQQMTHHKYKAYYKEIY